MFLIKAFLLLTLVNLCAILPTMDKMDTIGGSIYKLVGERIKKRRIELEMTQEDLAKCIGILRTSVANIESGRQRAPLNILYKICGILKIEPNNLMPTMNEVSASTVVSTMKDGGLPVKAAQVLRHIIEAND